MKEVAARAALPVALAVSSVAGADPTLFSAVPSFEVQLSWRWVAGAAVAGLILGFLLGWRTLDRRIRKKYGGLRIY